MSTTRTLSYQDQRVGWEQIHSVRKRPAHIIDAHIDCEMAWQAYDRVLEQEVHADTWDFRETDYARIERYRLLAEKAERRYSELYDQWMESYQ